MSEDEKLYEMEKHARAMLKTRRLWCEWTKSAGREIYMKTTKKRMGRDEFINSEPSARCTAFITSGPTFVDELNLPQIHV